MWRVILGLLLLLTIYSDPLSRPKTPTPPPQPDDGPGGRKLSHAVVTKNRYGKGVDEYWLYEPDSPKPRSAPLIVFLHGWGGTNPAVYGGWLDHLVKRGNIVVYPRYQSDLLTPLSEFTPNTIAALKNAIQRLQTEPGHVRPELNRVAIVGHSVGGLLTANVAALAGESGLPQVRAMMSVEPGRTWNPFRFINVPLVDLKRIPSATLLLAVAGDDDTIASDTDAKRIYYESVKIPAANKDFVRLMSDSHGRPQLRADHFAPVSPDKSYDNGEQSAFNRDGRGGPLRESIKERMEDRGKQNSNSNPSNQLPAMAQTTSSSPAANALDYYGLWKLFDALCDAAFYGKHRQYALGNTPQQRFMGVWSDGVRVKELVITDKP